MPRAGGTGNRADPVVSGFIDSECRLAVSLSSLNGLPSDGCIACGSSSPRDGEELVARLSPEGNKNSIENSSFRQPHH